MHPRVSLRRTYGRRPLGLGILLALLLTIFGGALSSSASGGACATAHQIRVLGDWTEIKAPVFAADPQGISAYAVDPVAPTVIFVTNGLSVMKSTDGGCEWKSVFEITSTPDIAHPGYVSPAAEIFDLAIPNRAHNTVYALSDLGDHGFGMISSVDSGTTWTVANGGLPIGAGAPSNLALAPSAPEIVYASATVERSVVETTSHLLYRSLNGGASWESMTNIGEIRLAPWGNVAVDPDDPDRLYGWDLLRLVVSEDGGRTFGDVLAPGGGVSAVDPFFRSGGPDRLIVFTGSTTGSFDPGPRMFYRSDDGGNRWATGQTPDLVNHAAHLQEADEIVGATDQPASRSVIGYRAAEDAWTPISLASFPPIFDLRSDNAATPSIYANAGTALLRFTGSLAGERQDLTQFIETPGRPSATIMECPKPGPPAPWKAGWDPNPVGEPVYVTNFDTGYTIRYDEHGTGTIVALAPKYSEGTTLDPLGNVISTTRFSNEVTRLDPETCKLEAIDYDLFTAEGPTYDAEGNLYVVDTNHFYIWRYSWPQYPRQDPVLIWRMPGFLEDLKIGPPGSPYEGYLFALYRDRRQDVDDNRVCTLVPCTQTGNPNAVAILKPSNDPKLEGWKRMNRDFIHLGPGGNDGVGHCTGFQSLGMGFMPDGHLLLGDACGSGVIRSYAPDGSGWTVFAQVPQPLDGILVLTKIAVSGSGHVFVTANNSFCGPGQNSATWLYRFQEDGTSMNPPFTQHLTCAVGIAAPSWIPPLPVDVPPVPVPEPQVPQKLTPPTRGAAVIPLAPPPPPIPIAAPAPGPAPIPELAPAPAPNPAPAPAAHPMAAAVPQQQEQPQMAFVTAANTVRQQVAEEYAMSSATRPNDPLLTAKFALVSGALMLVAAYGYVTFALSRARSYARVNDYD
jgi:hypothetical protein